MLRLEQRGPDDSGSYSDDRVQLGHRRLSIIDLSAAGHQPMVAAGGQVVLVFNGELYNFRALRKELEEGGVQFHGHSDTEVLLQMYIRHGLSMLPRLNGIFAFAIYDRRKAEVVLVRDGLGVKPLYFSEGSEGVAFSSEIKALLALTPRNQEIDHVSVYRYLTFLWCPGDGTPLKRVRKVEPGEVLVIRDGRVAQRRIWYRLPVERSGIVSLRGRAAVDAVAHGLSQAVERQLVADVPLGAFLSGGLDSSAIVALARRRVPELKCFTIENAGGRDEGEVDDLPYARRVAQHLGVELAVVRVDSKSMAEDLERMVYMLDEPLADPAPLNVLYISQLARSNGIKVLLSGAGGDDLFTGYRRHVAVGFDKAWELMPRRARHQLASWSQSLDQRSALGRRATKLLTHVSENENSRLAGHFVWTRNEVARSLLSEESLSAVAGVRADAPLVEFLGTLPTKSSKLSKMLGLEQKFFLADHNLIYTDKMSMAVGLEVRVPFLDMDLVDTASRIADTDRQRFGTSKLVLKRAMEPFLPKDIIYRRKTGFGAPLRRWIRFELREMLADLLSSESVQRRGIFSSRAVTQLVADNDAGRLDGAYTLFSLMCIELWCRHFLDRRGGDHASYYRRQSL